MATPKLGRIPHFDERSRGFKIRSLFDATPFVPRKRVWKLLNNLPLDQGTEGACVGFGWAAELGCTPVRHYVDNSFARKLYEEARTQDRQMGNHWSEGASVLAGARAVQKSQYVSRYHWAFDIQDVIESLVRKGPVVLGVNWYEDMYSTNSDGLVQIGGNIVGGHCILANGFWPDHPKFHADVVVWTNSWGPSYGINGAGYIRVSDLTRLLREDGEACIPTDLRR
jgi:hypothetical protein